MRPSEPPPDGPQAPAGTPSAAPLWDDRLLANPHAAADKRARVQRMFAAIAPSYDLNNRLHSLWMDQRWRRRAVKLAQLKPSDRVVDVACGTGDLALRFAGTLARLARKARRDAAPDARRAPSPTSASSDPLAASHQAFASASSHGRQLPQPVIGVDFTFQMLPIARAKASSRHGAASAEPAPGSTETHVSALRFPAALWVNGDAQSLPLPDACADVVSIAFGIRNVADPLAALREFRRVLRPGGRVIVLEFSLPRNPLLRRLYNFYFRKILPRTATWISRDKTGAYKYLPESVNTFIDRERMNALLAAAGFSQARQFPMTFGVCVCYRGVVE